MRKFFILLALLMPVTANAALEFHDDVTGWTVTNNGRQVDSGLSDQYSPHDMQSYYLWKQQQFQKEQNEQLMNALSAIQSDQQYYAQRRGY